MHADDFFSRCNIRNCNAILRKTKIGDKQGYEEEFSHGGLFGLKLTILLQDNFENKFALKIEY